MQVTGESSFVSAKSGTKNGKDWFMAKFLDDSADEFFTACSVIKMTVYNCLQHFTDTLKKETSIKSRFPKK